MLFNSLQEAGARSGRYVFNRAQLECRLPAGTSETMKIKLTVGKTWILCGTALLGIGSWSVTAQTFSTDEQQLPLYLD